MPYDSALSYDPPAIATGHVLVVDDQHHSRLTACALLEAEGYSVSEAEHGRQALQLVVTLRPDLVLLDVMMPEMNGYDVCTALKANEDTRLIPVVLVTALSDRQSRVRGIEAGADDFLTKPFDQLELAARVRSLVHQRHLNEDLDHTERALFAIAQAVEARDPNTGDHCSRLVKAGEAFGRYLHLPTTALKTLHWAGYLHDIGKIGVPDAILGKPGKHTPEEWAIMQSHVTIGEQICQPLRTMQDVLPIIRHHHERWDGSGYPDGLQGEAIPLLARVFQLVDIYDALRSDRPYKKAFSPQEAVNILRQETERGWRDPHLVNCFIDFLASEHAWDEGATASPLVGTPYICPS